MRPNTVESVLARSIPIPESGCFVWLGGTVKSGPLEYGRVRIMGRLKLAHRITYEHKYGQVSEGLELDHLCRVPLCINPDHLEAVSHKLNIMRGTSPSARHALKTHCMRDHEFTSMNTYVARDGSRTCRVCVRAAVRRRRMGR